MLREDAIYLAGLFDGEGCVQFHRRYRRVRKGRNPHYALTCTLDISMTDKPTIDHVRKITGVGSGKQKSQEHIAIIKATLERSIPLACKPQTSV